MQHFTPLLKSETRVFETNILVTTRYVGSNIVTDIDEYILEFLDNLLLDEPVSVNNDLRVKGVKYVVDKYISGVCYDMYQMYESVLDTVEGVKDHFYNAIIESLYFNVINYLSPILTIVPFNEPVSTVTVDRKKYNDISAMVYVRVGVTDVLT